MMSFMYGILMDHFAISSGTNVFLHRIPPQNVQVQSPPRIISDSTENTIFASVGTSRDLFCRAEGVPEPTISWEKDHLPVLPNNFRLSSDKFDLSTVQVSVS